MQNSLTKRPVDSDFNVKRWNQVTALRSRRVGIHQDAVDDLWVTEDGAVWRRRRSERDHRARTGRGLSGTVENARDWIDECLPRRRAGGARRRVVEHPPGSRHGYLCIAEGDRYPSGRCGREVTAGSALAVVGTVVVAKVCEVVNTVSATAMTNIASARNFIVVMLP